MIVAHVQTDGNVLLDSLPSPIPLSFLEVELHRAYAHRMERVLFITAELGATMQSVANVIDIAKRQIEVVAIPTPSVKNQGCWQVKPP